MLPSAPSDAPADQPGWRMPSETEPHERTWMAWPSSGYTLGSSWGEAETARRAWAAVANAIVDFEPVSMIVPPTAAAEATRLLSTSVELYFRPLDDAWYRDIGPTFVLGPDGRLGAVDWLFNGWGAQSWAHWELDAGAAEVAITAAGATAIRSALTNEGGGIHTDGQGTFLVTETVQLDPGRNPGWVKADVEAELARAVGAKKVIWLPRGLTRDSQTYGTRGHVDLLATFTAPGRLLVHNQTNPEHPDHLVSADLRSVLDGQTDAAGRPLELVELPAPTTLRDAEGWVDYSYVNHYVLNGAVLFGGFADPSDEPAAEILSAAYPGREVLSVDARPLFARGGGVHCITQQQPRSAEGVRR